MIMGEVNEMDIYEVVAVRCVAICFRRKRVGVGTLLCGLVRSRLSHRSTPMKASLKASLLV